MTREIESGLPFVPRQVVLDEDGERQLQQVNQQIWRDGHVEVDGQGSLRSWATLLLATFSTNKTPYFGVFFRDYFLYCLLPNFDEDTKLVSVEQVRPTLGQLGLNGAKASKRH